jgi:hypothetical protein
MMKKNLLYIVLLVVFNSCEKPSDCIESVGATVVKDVVVQAFNKIKVYKGIAVVISEGAEYKVQVEAGANFIDNIEVSQNGNQLVFKDRTSCNWVRDYGTTRILITTPTLEEIYSKTDRNISSNGILTFPSLKVYSLDKDGDGENGAGTGDFILNINNDYLHAESNNVSRFYLSGQTNHADLYFSFGDGRIEAQNLIAQNISVYHRGSNDMIVNPIQSLIGIMNSTGDIILKHIPTIVNVQQLYNGHVIYP